MTTDHPGDRQYTYDYTSETTGAEGFTIFAAVLLIIIAMFRAVEGIAAIANDNFYQRVGDYTLAFDLTTWGWIHLVIALLALGVGIGIWAGQTWARVCGVLVAGLSALTNFSFLPYYPLWSITVIAFDVAVIWALCVVIAADN